MFVIFGFGHRTNKENELRELTQCHHCYNATRWNISKQTNWFTLFFIPVIPVKTEYWKICPVCRQGKRLSYDTYMHLINKAS
jgi:hypothetical protein